MLHDHFLADKTMGHESARAFFVVGLLMNGTEAMENRFGLSDLVTLVLAGVILGVLSAFVRDWWQAGLIVFDPQLISEKLVAFGKAYF